MNYTKTNQKYGKKILKKEEVGAKEKVRRMVIFYFMDDHAAMQVKREYRKGKNVFVERILIK